MDKKRRADADQGLATKESKHVSWKTAAEERTTVDSRTIQDVEGEIKDDTEDFGGGYQLEPFNMQEERAEGIYDSEGNFVKDRRYFRRGRREVIATDTTVAGDEEEEEVDAWLKEYDELATKRIPFERGRPHTSNIKEEQQFDRISLLETIVGHLLPNETIATALRRFGGKGKQGSADKLHAKPFTENHQDIFNILTDAAHSLLSDGYYSIYSDTREVIASQISPTSRETPVDCNTITAPILWEYTVQTSSEVFGPFSGSQMKTWQEQGYFDKNCGVRFRQVKPVDSIYDDDENDRPFIPAEQICFQT